jgi:hypothetical protein
MSERAFIEMPDRIAHLPRDERGFPVPRFVEWIDGKPDFRVVSPRYMEACVRHDNCWLCGGRLGRNKAFVIGPMCGINRINSEPPCHYECARFAARNCPFLTRPLARRNERDLPEEARQAAGIPIARNPGCCLIWVTPFYRPFKSGHGNSGVLFELGAPERIEFWAQGRPATRAEVDESVDTGLPALAAVAHLDGPKGEAVLGRQVKAFTKLLDVALPKEAVA